MSDYWNNLSRMLGANPNHLRDEFAKQMSAIATPAAVDKLPEGCPGCRVQWNPDGTETEICCMEKP